MPIRILVADQSEARVFELAARGELLAFVREFQNPQAHLHERKLVSDRPGRRFANAPGTKRRGAVVHDRRGAHLDTSRRLSTSHASSPMSSKKSAPQARTIASCSAAPAFLGTLRAQMGKAVRACVPA